jgi:adenosylmethionine-8-amino-7-oxononanoate aminotransferase
VSSTIQADLVARDQAHLIHPLHSRDEHRSAHVWVEGRGAVLIDAAGREYLDGLSGLWNVVVGHGRKELAAAAARQMETLAYCSGYSGSTNPRAIELGERLAATCYPSINRFFFTSGGGESSESAFKTARYYWKLRGRPEKTKVISRQWAYHGVTLAAMSATGIASYWPMFEPRTPGFLHVASPYPYRFEAPAGAPSQGIAAADTLADLIEREGPDTVAAFIAEPVQGAGGVIVPQDDYFPRIREICNRYDVLLIADEVITGFGRTGKRFALDHWGVEPDMVAFAKAITSGYVPFGGIGVSDPIAEALDAAPPDKKWMHAFTYSAHPVCCAVASANLDIIENEGLIARAGSLGKRLLEGLKGLAGHPHVGDVRGLGLMCAVELVEDKATKREFDPSQAIGPKVHAETQRRGLFSRLRGDCFLLAPPFVTTEDQIDRCVAILGESIEAVLG